MLTPDGTGASADYDRLRLALGQALRGASNDGDLADILALIGSSLRLKYAGYGPTWSHPKSLAYAAAVLLDEATEGLR